MIANGKHKTKKAVGKHMVIDPEICHGQMTFKGTRVPVTAVLTLLGKGYSFEQMLKSYPEVSRIALQEAVRLAIHSLQKRYDMPLVSRRRVTA